MNEWQSFEAARNDRRSNESKHGATKNEKVDAGIDRMFVCAMFDMLFIIYNIRILFRTVRYGTGTGNTPEDELF